MRHLRRGLPDHSADAATSILRGRQLVVAGDDKQLPPSAWFVSDNTDEEPEPAEGAEPVPLLAGTGGFESILNAVRADYSPVLVRWHPGIRGGVRRAGPVFGHPGAIRSGPAIGSGSGCMGAAARRARWGRCSLQKCPDSRRASNVARE